MAIGPPVFGPAAHAHHYAAAPARGLVDIGYVGTERTDPRWQDARHLAVQAVVSAEEAERQRRLQEWKQLPDAEHQTAAVPAGLVDVAYSGANRQDPGFAASRQISLSSVREAEEVERRRREAEWASAPAEVHSSKSAVVLSEEEERMRRVMASEPTPARSPAFVALQPYLHPSPATRTHAPAPHYYAQPPQFWY